MTEKDLSEIKTRIRKFHELVIPIIEHWDKVAHNFITMSVLVQNAGFDGSECKNYNHNDAEMDLMKVLDILKAMSEYHDQCHVTSYVYNEVNDIIVTQKYLQS